MKLPLILAVAGCSYRCGGVINALDNVVILFRSEGFLQYTRSTTGWTFYRLPNIWRNQTVRGAMGWAALAGLVTQRVSSSCLKGTYTNEDNTAIEAMRLLWWSMRSRAFTLLSYSSGDVCPHSEVAPKYTASCRTAREPVVL